MQEFTINFSAVGENLGKTYAGNFVFKPFLTMSEEIEAHRLFTQWSYGLDKDTSIVDDLIIYAYLKKYCVSTDAAWWEDMIGMKLADQNPLKELYREFVVQRAKIRIQNNPAAADDYTENELKEIGYEAPNQETAKEKAGKSKKTGT